MEIILILIVITFIFSITIGLIIMNRDSVPDVLVEENKKEEETNKKDLKNDSNDDEII